MTRRLAHRGPDAEGYWHSPDGRVHLGHRRLAIIDLTPTGAQPMRTADGRYTLVYNGEIYNFPALRSELAGLGHLFAGTSDTEVLLQAVVEWGVAATLPKLNGMFAFALWDDSTRRLWLARDRFGEKPLYYAGIPGGMVFGSELKALAEHPAFGREIDREVLALFLRFGYVPAPHCIFRGASKLAPGHYLAVGAGGAPALVRPYWSARQLVEQRQLRGIAPTDPALGDLLDAALRRAVKSRMMADVPLGAFLSGGIDSSTVVALMQAQSGRPVKTFTIGFSSAAYDEAKDAAAVARHLGTEHHEHYVSSTECLEVIHRLPQIYDEPFADSSQIPTTLVSQFARRHVTVALSGDAGDELFGGYNRYLWSSRIWPALEHMPGGLRSVAGSMLRRVSPRRWDRWLEIANRGLPDRCRVRGGGDKLHKLAAALGARTPDGLYRSLVSQWQRPAEALAGPTEPEFLERHFADAAPGLHYVERMMYLDLLTYLPDDILCKVDRASMSTGLEARVPFLDNELVSLAWDLPLSSKIHRGVGKWPLRQVLRRYVPEGLVNRPKMGFAVPIGEWLRGPLRDWAEAMLSERRLSEGGFFHSGVIRGLWAEHLSGRSNVQHALWGVLMFESWRQDWM